MTDMDVISNGMFLLRHSFLKKTGRQIFLRQSSGDFNDPGSHGGNNVVAGDCSMDFGRRASGMV
ncbi:hypothetical protein AAEU41_24705 [Pantoea agglomerans]